MKNLFNLSGKNILITGATSGIGKAITLECIQYGANIICCGRSKEKLKQLETETKGQNIQIIKADINNPDERENLISSCTKLNGIVHCVGIGHRLPVKFLTQDDINQVMNTNFISPVLLQSELLRNKKIEKSSSIIFIASKAFESPSIGNSIYSASKGALISFAKCLALELAAQRTRVNCISPAMIWTDLIYEGGISKEQHEEAQKKYPLGRYGYPEDLVGLTIYLLSDASKWMTGSNIEITGGGE